MSDSVFEYVLSALGDQVCVYLRGAEALVDQESLPHADRHHD